MTTFATFAEVRAACAAVTAEASWVRIDPAGLERFVDALPDRLPTPVVDREHFFLGAPDETAAYVLTLAAVNFGSGWHPHLRKDPGRSGSVTMMGRLASCFRARGPFTATELARVQAADCAALFDQPLTPPVDELMDLLARSLRDLGRYALDRFDGSLATLVSAADHRAEALASLLVALPSFRDVALYRGRAIPFLKRAQLASADLAAALGGHPLGHFDDLDRLTLCADNLVPHVLRVEGVLDYHPSLAARIRRGELLAPGSEEEVEIRAVAVHAGEQIVDRLRARGLGGRGGGGAPVTAAGLDSLLWHRGQQSAYKAIPRHRCRTQFY